ncbi:restriction endonuclease subunit S [Agrobacterium vitis]|uniref:restriction endonuclease subunit S n=1 Tax=Agrobacterium vitis TaxID=373 RepID=UPI001F1A6D51|nr:restriction endonuclease subunit S [Agrobacterium vitis]MCF1468986.1 restriction endonuclease subunit S [Agrobacterium vitis]
MNEWEIHSIGDLIEGGAILIHKDGNHGANYPRVSDFKSEGLPFLTAKSLSGWSIDVENAPKLSSEKASSFRFGFIAEGDVLLSHNATVGRVAIVPELSGPAVIGTSLTQFRTDQTKLSSPYLAIYFSSRDFQEQLSFVMAQTTRNQVPISAQRRLPVVVPPLSTQHRIADFVMGFNAKIELNRRMNETLEAMAQAIFRDWFVDFGPTRRKLEGATDPLTIMGGLVQDTEWAQALADLFPAALGDDGLPEGWKKKALLEEAKLISGGTPKTAREEYWDGGIPWASAKDVSQCGETLLLDTERSITQSGLDNSSTRMVPKFSTVVVARGATTGRYCMFAESMAMNQTCYALHSASGRPFLLYNMFGSLIEELVQAAHGSVFDTITTKTLATGFVIDAEGVSAEFEKTAAPLYKAIENNSRQNRTLAATRDLLLPKLMSGEIRLSEAEGLMEAAQ